MDFDNYNNTKPNCILDFMSSSPSTDLSEDAVPYVLKQGP